MTQTALAMMMDEMGEGHSGSGGRLVATDGRELPLRAARIAGQAGGGVARVTLEQQFENPYDEPLTVEYQLPMPADGAVGGFVFTVGDSRIVGEIDGRDAARERFEEAIASGHSAALLEQERSSLFTQQVGNIPPRTRVVAEITVDQRLRWVAEGAWEWRFPTVVGPRYVGAPGRVADAERLLVDVAETSIDARATLELLVLDAVTAAGGEAERAAFESPSHAIDVAEVGPLSRVRMAKTGAGERGVRLDRDVVVRWHVATPEVGVSLELCRPEHDIDARVGDGEGDDESGDAASPLAYGLLTLVPPSPEAGAEPVPRDLTLLLDTSGSMQGAPLAQAVRVAAALVQTLGPHDRVEMIAFGSSARRWRKQPAQATRKVRDGAVAWLRKQRASGGTEMCSAVLEALAPLRSQSQRQVVLLTDGYVGFESEVIAALRQRKPEGARLHVVGVGPAVNRALTAGLSRAGRGAELIVGLDEDVERVLGRLVARTAAPVVVDIALGGSALREVAPAAPPDLYAGHPVTLAVAVDAGGGALSISGTIAGAEPFTRELRVGAVEPGEGREALPALFARERVEDYETERLGFGADAASIDARVEALGVAFQIATRLTSWIAVSEQPTVDADAPARRERMPHEVPAGLSVAGLGLRGPYDPAADMSAKTLAGVVRDPIAEAVLAQIRRRSAATAAGGPPSGVAPGGVAPGAPAPRAPMQVEARAEAEERPAPRAEEQARFGSASAAPKRDRASITSELPSLSALPEARRARLWLWLLLLALLGGGLALLLWWLL